jgi:hypothetical protein
MNDRSTTKRYPAPRSDASERMDSRRGFLLTAAAGVVTAATAPGPAIASTPAPAAPSKEGRAAQDILRRHGGEFGPVRDVR